MAFKPADCPQAVNDVMTSVATNYNIPRYFLYAVVARESYFDPNALNPSNDGRGLTQLTYAAHGGTPYPMNLSAPDNNHQQWIWDMGINIYGQYILMTHVTSMTNAYNSTENLNRYATVYFVRWYQELKRRFPSEGTTRMLKRAAYNYIHGIFDRDANDNPLLDENHYYFPQFNAYMNEYQPACEADDGLWNGTPVGTGDPPAGTPITPPPAAGGPGSASTWTTPRTWADGEVVTASLFNTHIRDNMRYLHQTGGFIREGGSTTEGSTTSTAGADVVTISGLSIPPERPVMILVSFRKTTAGGSLLAAGAGIKVNGTIVGEARNSNNSNEGLGALSNTSTSQSALTQLWVGPTTGTIVRTTIGRIITSDPLLPQQVTQLIFPQVDANWPTNTTTAIAIRGKTASLSATLYVNQVHIYSVGFN